MNEENGAGKGQSKWTDKQNEAHNRAELLRQQLAELESGDETVAKLVNSHGDDAGTWEEYQMALSMKQQKENTDMDYSEKIRKQTRDYLYATIYGRNAIGITSSDIENETKTKVEEFAESIVAIYQSSRESNVLYKEMGDKTSKEFDLPDAVYFACTGDIFVDEEIVPAANISNNDEENDFVPSAKRGKYSDLSLEEKEFLYLFYTEKYVTIVNAANIVSSESASGWKKAKAIVVYLATDLALRIQIAKDYIAATATINSGGIIPFESSSLAVDMAAGYAFGEIILGNVIKTVELFKVTKSALRFTQTTASSTFSEGGTFSGYSISDIASAIRNGLIDPVDVPVEYIVKNGVKLIVNTRSALALKRAGIPEEMWNLVDKTNDADIVKAITDRLAKNKLPGTGTDVLRITGYGQNMSNIV